MSSKVGHILSIRFAKQPLHYPIIAEYTRNGLTSYVVPLWKHESQSFTEYREDSYFLEEYRSSFSKEAFQLSEQHKACARAFRVQQLLKEAKTRLNRAKAFTYGSSKIVATHGVSGQWGFRAENELLFADASPYIAQCQALVSKLGALFREEMALAGITI